MAKTLYHSELVQMGPVKVRVKSDVLPSKFKDKPPYVALEVGGEERNYTTENDECAAFFEGQKGRSFTIVAEGRKEEAVITYVGEAAEDDAAPAPKAAKAPAKAPPKTNRPPANPPAARTQTAAPSSPPPAQRPPPAPKPPPETAAQKVTRARKHAARTANVQIVAFAAARWGREQIRLKFGEEVNERLFHFMFSNITMQLIMDGFVGQMPSIEIEIAPAHGADNDPQSRPEASQESDNDGGNVQ